MVFSGLDAFATSRQFRSKKIRYQDEGLITDF